MLETANFWKIFSERIWRICGLDAAFLLILLPIFCSNSILSFDLLIKIECKCDTTCFDHLLEQIFILVLS